MSLQQQVLCMCILIPLHLQTVHGVLYSCGPHGRAETIHDSAKLVTRALDVICFGPCIQSCVLHAALIWPCGMYLAKQRFVEYRVACTARHVVVHIVVSFKRRKNIRYLHNTGLQMASFDHDCLIPVILFFFFSRLLKHISFHRMKRNS